MISLELQKSLVAVPLFFCALALVLRSAHGGAAWILFGVVLVLGAGYARLDWLTRVPRYAPIIRERQEPGPSGGRSPRP